MKNLFIKNLKTVNELKDLISVFSLAFESDYSVSHEYLERIFENNTIIFLGAFLEQKIVGGLVAFEMTPIHGNKELYIYDIAVHPEYQKQGIGTRLIESLKAEAKLRGISTIFVEAESNDVDAVSFYRRIGGEEISVSHFNFNL